jgi:fission process protein 1
MTRTVEAAQGKVKELSDRNADSTDSDIRYLAYGARLRTALRATTRYIAYVCESNFIHLCLM